MVISRTKSRLLLTAAILPALWTSAAAAQTQPQTTAPGTERETQMQDQTSTGATPLPGGVSAQEAEAAGGEDIVVTGFRASLNSAINAKRAETASVDVIKAEDIADFPDLNLAESLQRIPGVAITRVGGEGRSVSVRGLGPEYTRVRINGMEALTTSGAADAFGGANRGRGFDFNVFASELFNSLTVRKTASADVEEGSLGATIDLQTARPFDYRKATLAASAQVGYNDLSRKPAYRVALMGTDTWLDGRLGALVSVAYDKRDIFQEGTSTTRWDVGGSQGGFNAASTLPGYTLRQINDSNPATALYHPRLPAQNAYRQSENRLGITGSLQFRPTDQTLFNLDALYSKLDGSREERVWQAIGLSRSGTGKPQTILRDGVVDADRSLVYGVFDNVDIRSHHRYDELSTEFQQYTASMEHQFSDSFKVGALGGYSRSLFDNPINTTVTLDRVDVDGFSYDYRDGPVPALNIGFDPTVAANWSMINGTSEVRLRPQSVKNQFKTAKAFAEWEVTDGFNVKGGVDWRRFNYDSDSQRRIAGETVVQTLTPAQVSEIATLYSGFGRNLNLPSINPTAWIIADLDKFAQTYGIYSNTGLYQIGGIENASARGDISGVRENDIGAYLQVEFRQPLGTMELRGDAGVRYVQTKQYSNGYAAVGNTINLVESERTYENWLPSVNLVLEFTPQLLARFGAARTLARPAIGSLTPGGSVSVQGGNRTFSTGNPSLQPTASDNLDLSVEWYPSQGSLVSVAGFYKNIGTFASTLRTQIPYSALGLPPELIAGTTAGPNDVFEVTRPVNTEGGKLKGFEVNVQQTLGFIGSTFRNFGVLANYTFVDSNISYLTSETPGAPTVDATLVGLSKHAWNGTVYYEDKRFSIRGSAAYRSGYLTQVPGRAGQDVEGTHSTLNFDAQTSFGITDQLRVSIEALNLTDEPNDQYIGPDRSVAYNHTGRQFYLGLRYTY